MVEQPSETEVDTERVIVNLCIFISRIMLLISTYKPCNIFLQPCKVGDMCNTLYQSESGKLWLNG